LYASLSKLDDLERLIEANYHDQNVILQRLRDEYLGVVRYMRSAAQQEFEAVIKESQDHLLEPSFTSLHTTSQWLNYFKNTPSTTEELFGGVMEAGNEETFRKMYRFEVWTRLDFLENYQYCSWYRRADAEAQTTLKETKTVQIQTESIDWELARATQDKFNLEARVQQQVAKIKSLNKENATVENQLEEKSRSIKLLKDEIADLKRELKRAERDHSPIAQGPMSLKKPDRDYSPNLQGLIAARQSEKRPLPQPKQRTERLELRAITPVHARSTSKLLLTGAAFKYEEEEVEALNWSTRAPQTARATSQRMEFAPIKEQPKNLKHK
jgi:septal ring factor EnvC (AmiA/AmiB activator)